MQRCAAWLRKFCTILGPTSADTSSATLSRKPLRRWITTRHRIMAIFSGPFSYWSFGIATTWREKLHENPPPRNVGRCRQSFRKVERPFSKQRRRHDISNLGVDGSVVEQLRFAAPALCLERVGRRCTRRHCAVLRGQTGALGQKLEMPETDRRWFARF